MFGVVVCVEKLLKDLSFALHQNFAQLGDKVVSSDQPLLKLFELIHQVGGLDQVLLALARMNGAERLRRHLIHVRPIQVTVQLQVSLAVQVCSSCTASNLNRILNLSELLLNHFMNFRLHNQQLALLRL